MTAIKTKLNDKRAESLKLDTRSLFEAIKSFLQLTDMIREVGVNIPRRLFHIDMFSKMTIKKCILDIKLTERPFVGHNKKEDNMDSCSLHNRTKSVSVVETKYLCIAFGNNVSFKTLN